MSKHFNLHGQPTGEPLAEWTPRRLPQPVTLHGQFCRLEPINPERHAQELYAAYASSPDDRNWTYLPVEFTYDEKHFLPFIESIASSADRKHFAVVSSALESAVGMLSLMRADPANGAIEIGWVAFSPLLQQTPASTEAHFLLMQYVFDDLKYRRCEWKCDILNAPSRKAAERLGFTFEGVFRQAAVYKQRSRDTAWFSVIDQEWPACKRALVTWLAPSNFAPDGKQMRTLKEIREQQASSHLATP